MPELPDVAIYVERLRALIVGQPLEKIRITSVFVLRTFAPSPRELEGATVEAVERMGKRILICVAPLRKAPDDRQGDAEGRWIVIHLMIAGRLRWKPRGAPVPGKVGLAAFDFPTGTLIFTEASPKKRASLHLVAGRAGLADFDRGGLDVFGASVGDFAARLTSERHTVKRALTDPTLFDGIGNAYSDEILHAAKLSPFRMTSAMTAHEIATLHRACIETLETWTQRMRAEVGAGFPDKVTAFRPEMAVHGKYGQPCPVCGTPVQRIVHADNEANYCPTCQTEGRLLADRALSRLLKEDWPRSLEELEERRRPAAPAPATTTATAPEAAKPAPARAPKVPKVPKVPKARRARSRGAEAEPTVPDVGADASNTAPARGLGRKPRPR